MANEVEIAQAGFKALSTLESLFLELATIKTRLTAIASDITTSKVDIDAFTDLPDGTDISTQAGTQSGNATTAAAAL